MILRDSAVSGERLSVHGTGGSGDEPEGPDRTRQVAGARGIHPGKLSGGTPGQPGQVDDRIEASAAEGIPQRAAVGYITEDMVSRQRCPVEGGYLEFRPCLPQYGAAQEPARTCEKKPQNASSGM